MAAIEMALSTTKTHSLPGTAWTSFYLQQLSDKLKAFGTHTTRYGLVVVLLWIGGMRFTAYEAEGIQPLVANSPFMGWVYGLMSITAFSALLGVIEIAVGLLIALRPV